MATAAVSELRLAADTAADLMMANPVSIRDNASFREALVLLTTKGFSAAPVTDEAGRLVGVLSHSDLLIHDRERLEHSPAKALPDKTYVRDIMTPAVFSVAPGTPAAKVVSEMLALRVHHLFVVDANGVLVAAISGLDILRHLKPAG